MKEHIRHRIKSGQKHSFISFDISEVEHRVNLWRKLMPRVEIFFAAKVNPDPEIMKKSI